MNDYVIAIIGMSLATQIPRILPAFTGRKTIRNRYFTRFLASIPLAALGTLIVPGVFTVGDSFYIGLTGGLCSLALAYKGINIMYNIIVSSLLVSALIYFF
ncbi:AzlD domain-containing protein [Proteiniclasticum sp. C24MP]|uniref:AzlD domain-containing protein n=1 Tax=Proteiniclasticum sp. C24MP TaxID=3374101 RepID=UPI00375453D7